MTALELFFYISMGFFLQITIFACLAFYRHWLVYQEMKSRLAGFSIGLSDDLSRNGQHPWGSNSGRMVGWEGFRELRVQRKLFEDASQSVCSFYLAPTDGKTLPSFKPGQFLTFQLNIPNPTTGQPQTIVRCYSLSDRPGLDYYRVTIKRIPPPANSTDVPPGLSSNTFHDAIHEGSRLLVKAPGGHFFLEKGETPIVLIAGGIGITPLLSMVNASIEKESPREIWLFYGVRHSAEHVMKEQLENLAKRHSHFRLHVCYSQPLPGDVQGKDFQHLGHIDIILLRLTLSLKPYQFYVCGPRGMMESLVPALYDWGVPEAHIHYETFGPASLAGLARPHPKSAKTTAVDGITVTFSKSGKSLLWDENAGSLLNFAELNGIEVASGCRAGSCGACQTIIQGGKVAYFQSPDFTPDPGSCLLCISHPKCDLSLLA